MKKILVISSVTGELQNATPETASAVIGRVLANSCSKSLDAVAFSTAAADAAAPAGLLHNVTPLVGSAGGGLTAMASDLGAMAQAMANAGVDPVDLIVVAAPRQAITLQLLAGPKFEHPILSTTALADGNVAAFAPAAVASSVDGQPTVETSKEPVVHFDTVPLPIASPGAPNTIAAPSRSAFQENQILLRVRAWATWSITAPGGVQVVNGVSW